MEEIWEIFDLLYNVSSSLPMIPAAMGLFTFGCHLFMHEGLNHSIFKNSFFCWTQKKIFWRMSVTKQLTVAIEFHIGKKKYHWSQWLPSTVWLPIIFKIYSIVSNKRKKLIQV